jgi:hypothetical protein
MPREPVQQNITIINNYNNSNNNYAIPERVVYDTGNVSPKSRGTAIFLCCLGFIGFNGLHRLYVGKTGTGLLWFFTVGLYLFGTIADLIVLCCGNFTDSDGRQLR